MRKPWKSIGIVALMSLLCLGAAFFTLRAVAQTKDKEAPPPATQSTEEESATIKDDPTIAPDAAQSADNNISFPTDI